MQSSQTTPVGSHLATAGKRNKRGTFGQCEKQSYYGVKFRGEARRMGQKLEDGERELPGKQE